VGVPLCTADPIEGIGHEVTIERRYIDGRLSVDPSHRASPDRDPLALVPDLQAPRLRPRREVGSVLSQRVAARWKLARRVAARWKLAAFIPDKFFRDWEKRHVALLKGKPGSDPDDWIADLIELGKFYEGFAKDFEQFDVLPQAREAVDRRAKMADEAMRRRIDNLREVKELYGDRPLKWDEPRSDAYYEVVSKLAKAYRKKGDLLVWAWKVDKGKFERLVAKYEAHHRGKPLSHDDRNKLRALAARTVKRERITTQKPHEWVDWIREVLAANYSEQAIQKTAPITEFDLGGVKIVIDDTTVTQAQAHKYVDSFDKVRQDLKRKKLDKAWYGTIFVQCEDCGGVNPNTGGGVGGWYEGLPDTVTIFSRPGTGAIQLTIHEPGHRYWVKHLTSTQRARFVDLIKLPSVARPWAPAKPKGERPKPWVDIMSDMVAARQAARAIVKEVEGMVQGPVGMNRLALALEQLGSAFIEPTNQAVPGLQPPPRDGLSKLIYAFMDPLPSTGRGTIEPTEAARLVRELRDWVDDTYERVRNESDALADAYETEEAKAESEYRDRLNEWNQSLEESDKPVTPVSDYGKSNVDEAWAEAFMHYVLDLDMARDQAESFKSVLEMR